MSRVNLVGGATRKTESSIEGIYIFDILDSISICILERRVPSKSSGGPRSSHLCLQIIRRADIFHRLRRTSIDYACFESSHTHIHSGCKESVKRWKSITSHAAHY